MELKNEQRSFSEWEIIFETEINSMTIAVDPAHDILHLKRVVKTAKSLCASENGNLNIVVPAAWLHDFVVVPKNSPLRKEASKISAARAIEFLQRVGYPEQFHASIAHCIQAHSFSANISTETVEAEIVQDADRLDGLGAIGLARCFITAGQLQRPIYSEDDPFCSVRSPDDSELTIDHFYTKLLKLAGTLKTKSAKEEGARRTRILSEYLDQLSLEI